LNESSLYQVQPTIVPLPVGEYDYVREVAAGAQSSFAVVEYTALYYWGALSTTFNVSTPTLWNVTAEPAFNACTISSITVMQGDLQDYWFAAIVFYDEELYSQRFAVAYSGNMQGQFPLGNSGCNVNVGDVFSLCEVDISALGSIATVKAGANFILILDYSGTLYGFGSKYEMT